MPHFVIHCNDSVVKHESPEKIMQKVYDAAESTGLFSKRDIKVRISPFQLFNNGNTKDDFIHIFGNMMEGRSAAQKANLSKKIITELKEMFPAIPVISINIRDFEAASYCNRSMV